MRVAPRVRLVERSDVLADRAGVLLDERPCHELHAPDHIGLAVEADRLRITEELVTDPPSLGKERLQREDRIDAAGTQRGDLIDERYGNEVDLARVAALPPDGFSQRDLPGTLERVDGDGLALELLERR